MRIVAEDQKSRAMGLDGIVSVLDKAVAGRLGTINADGTPYLVPVNFAFKGDRVYIHCATEGKKLDNIRKNSAVCFQADEIDGLFVNAEKPCSSDTFYRSVIASGTARIITGREEKTEALRVIMEKYARGKPVGEFREEALAKTAIIEITVDVISGKALYPP